MLLTMWAQPHKMHTLTPALPNNFIYLIIFRGESTIKGRERAGRKGRGKKIDNVHLICLPWLN